VPKKPLSLQKTADRALCPVPTANVMQMKVHEIARWMRGAGVTETLTPQQATAWKVDPRNAPEWFTGLLAENASCAAEREYRERQADLEYEHRMLNLTEKVTKRLLAGAKHFRNPDAELIAQDMALRASKELCRAHTEACGKIIPELLSDLDIAALRWAGIDPHDHSTWIVHRGDCAA
jgi:hypothetical protein